MGELNIPQTEWIREYLAEHFSDQPLPERGSMREASGVGLVPAKLEAVIAIYRLADRLQGAASCRFARVIGQADPW